MPSSNPRRRFEDILADIDRVRAYIGGMGEAEFLRDEKTQDAVKHCLLRIAEAAAKLGETAERLLPDMPWSAIRGLGNHLRHEYDRIEIEAIWSIATRQLDPLDADIRELLRSETTKF